MAIKAIDTVYNGYRFRSRLEARWAVFFDHMGFEYQYELEGFDLDGIWYLPDFYLPKVKMWAEVKAGEFSYDEISKVKLLAKHTNQPVLMLGGEPKAKPYWAWQWEEFEGKKEAFDNDYVLSNYCDYYQNENRFFACTGLSDEEYWDKNHLYEIDVMCHDMKTAIYAAKQARFEYGETPERGSIKIENPPFYKGVFKPEPAIEDDLDEEDDLDYDPFERETRKYSGGGDEL